VATLLSFLLCLLAACCLPLAAQNTTTKPNPKPEKAKAASPWTDPATSLMWTMRDNGSDVNWSGATYYCQTLSLGGLAAARVSSCTQPVDSLSFVVNES
jgi:hypothetical protein